MRGARDTFCFRRLRFMAARELVNNPVTNNEALSRIVRYRTFRRIVRYRWSCRVRGLRLDGRLKPGKH